jgi:hypothetical protein
VGMKVDRSSAPRGAPLPCFSLSAALVVRTRLSDGSSGACRRHQVWRQRGGGVPSEQVQTCRGLLLATAGAAAHQHVPPHTMPHLWQHKGAHISATWVPAVR